MRCVPVWIAFPLALALAGCAGLPAVVERPASSAIADGSATPLGRLAVASRPDPELSGFRLLPMPRHALHARIELVRRAERTIDVQYYLLQNDITGRALLRALREAGARGVRVRILIDDLYTARSDALLRALAACPGVELRLFNPFPAARGSLWTRFGASLFDFNRVHRRMHNKLLIADNAMAIAGGRNIANEYFLHDSASNFIDIDLLATGPIVPRLSWLFDTFWNSVHVFPIQSLVAADAPDAALRERFDAMTSSATTPVPEMPDAKDLLGYNPLALDLDAGAEALALTWARAEAYADAPEKVLSTALAAQPLAESARDTVLYNVRRYVRAAEREVFQSTPYLIPGREGMESMRLVRARNVQFSIVTNSLAATDETLVHAGYRRYRPEMLRLGVELYELSPRRSGKSDRFGMYGSSGGRLHGKAAVIDRRMVFIGSLNFDPRSDAHNTELGLFIFSPAIAQQVYSLIGFLQREGAYQVRLRADDQTLEWVSPAEDADGTPESILRDEPEADGWTRWKLELLAPLIPEHLL